MRFLRVKENDEERFAAATEIAMDLNLGRSDFGDDFYLIIGCRVAVLLNEETFVEPEGTYFEQSWRSPAISVQALRTATPVQAWQSFWRAMIPVTPVGPLPPNPPRPPSIYGHLPFKTTTLPDTVIYRWKAYREQVCRSVGIGARMQPRNDLLFCQSRVDDPLRRQC
jgi:hypothetical protein